MTPKLGVLPKSGSLAPQGYTKTVFFDYPLGSKHSRTLKKKRCRMRIAPQNSAKWSPSHLTPPMAVGVRTGAK